MFFLLISYKQLLLQGICGRLSNSPRQISNSICFDCFLIQLRAFYIGSIFVFALSSWNPWYSWSMKIQQNWSAGLTWVILRLSSRLKSLKLLSKTWIDVSWWWVTILSLLKKNSIGKQIFDAKLFTKIQKYVLNSNFSLVFNFYLFYQMLHKRGTIKRRFLLCRFLNSKLLFVPAENVAELLARNQNGKSLKCWNHQFFRKLSLTAISSPTNCRRPRLQ